MIRNFITAARVNAEWHPGHIIIDATEKHQYPDLTQPFRWIRHRNVYVSADGGDFLDPQVPDNMVARMFSIMLLNSNHRYFIETGYRARLLDLCHDQEFIAKVIGLAAIESISGTGSQTSLNLMDWTTKHLFIMDLNDTNPALQVSSFHKEVESAQEEPEPIRSGPPMRPPTQEDMQQAVTMTADKDALDMAYEALRSRRSGATPAIRIPVAPSGAIIIRGIGKGSNR